MNISYFTHNNTNREQALLNTNSKLFSSFKVQHSIKKKKKSTPLAVLAIFICMIASLSYQNLSISYISFF